MSAGSLEPTTEQVSERSRELLQVGTLFGRAPKASAAYAENKTVKKHNVRMRAKAGKSGSVPRLVEPETLMMSCEHSRNHNVP